MGPTSGSPTSLSPRLWKYEEFIHTADGSAILHQLLWYISHDLQGFMEMKSRWLTVPIGLFLDPLHPPIKIGIGKPSFLTLGYEEFMNIFLKVFIQKKHLRGWWRKSIPNFFQKKHTVSKISHGKSYEYSTIFIKIGQHKIYMKHHPPTILGKFIYKSLTFMFRPFWGPDSLTKQLPFRGNSLGSELLWNPQGSPTRTTPPRSEVATREPSGWMEQPEVGIFMKIWDAPNPIGLVVFHHPPTWKICYSQIGSFVPGVKIKSFWNHHLESFLGGPGMIILKMNIIKSSSNIILNL